MVAHEIFVSTLGVLGILIERVKIGHHPLTTPFILSRIMLPINIKITAGYHTQCGKHGDHVIYATVYSHKLIEHPTVDAVQGHDMYVL